MISARDSGEISVTSCRGCESPLQLPAPPCFRVMMASSVPPPHKGGQRVDAAAPHARLRPPPLCACSPRASGASKSASPLRARARARVRCSPVACCRSGRCVGAALGRVVAGVVSAFAAARARLSCATERERERASICAPFPLCDSLSRPGIVRERFGTFLHRFYSVFSLLRDTSVGILCKYIC